MPTDLTIDSAWRQALEYYADQIEMRSKNVRVTGGERYPRNVVIYTYRPLNDAADVDFDLPAIQQALNATRVYKRRGNKLLVQHR